MWASLQWAVARLGQPGRDHRLIRASCPAFLFPRSLEYLPTYRGIPCQNRDTGRLFGTVLSPHVATERDGGAADVTSRRTSAEF